MNELSSIAKERHREAAAAYRAANRAFAHWAAGYGVIEHNPETQVRIFELAARLEALGHGDAKKLKPSKEQIFTCLAAADRLASAAMWLVVHATYARNVYLDGRDLEASDFKAQPEGHTGGALNMVPAYVGYLVANAISGITRSWLMGQGHCVAAIDATNLLVGNMTAAHAERYDVSDRGLTQYVRDFYSYAIRPDGRPASPLGSHVNPHTAGGMLEGGYLGFAELQYVHVPLPGESLVAFLSDGAFEEQRGSDWAPRWWRAEDTGVVVPILIANGRRIDQRTTVAQQGGVAWLLGHLRNNGFEPSEIDGRDPAAFAWAIIEMETRLAAAGHAAVGGRAAYPVPLPYVVAETVKGFGFPGAGTNPAHNLPLGANPAEDEAPRQLFNRGARDLWVPPAELASAVAALDNHEASGRLRERDHAAAHRHPPAPRLPEPRWRAPASAPVSPMKGIDDFYADLVELNPGLRARIGNPDELRSNGMNRALDHLKHRVTAPEPGIAEATDGRVITALNEEAVVSAALANKAGLNLVVTYEAFAPKMLGAVRQEIIFARHQRAIGELPGWLAVPLALTSHTWENGKNEQSHQDPTMAEALLGEMNDVSRVLFPADVNSAAAALEAVFQRRGEIFTLVTAKRPAPVRFAAEVARQLLREGGVRLRGGGPEARLVLTAVGGYQLEEVLRASERLESHDVPHSVVYLIEPGRFRAPRDEQEAAHMASEEVREALFPAAAEVRIFVSHIRPESMAGVLRPLDTGWKRTAFLGYRNQGGTLDIFGMLFANQSTWAHVVRAAAEALGRHPEEWLTPAEAGALRGEGDPRVLEAHGKPTADARVRDEAGHRTDVTPG
jgi:phosphoketolase